MVFSGIIEEQGIVQSLTASASLTLWDGSLGEGCVLVISAARALEGAYIGASISVEGTCLTVTAFDASSFTVGLAPETLRRTSLGGLRAGDAVNLERALPADGRNSGHYVQGHVDGTGELEATWREGESLWVRIGSVPAETLAGVQPKGFIAVDGVSLTVCEVAATSFTFMLVAHTQAHITLPRKAIGARINLEVDALGRYAARAAGRAAEAAVADLSARLDAALAALAALSARTAALEEERRGAGGAVARD